MGECRVTATKEANQPFALCLESAEMEVSEMYLLCINPAKEKIQNFIQLKIYYLTYMGYFG